MLRCRLKALITSEAKTWVGKAAPSQVSFSILSTRHQHSDSHPTWQHPRLTALSFLLRGCRKDPLPCILTVASSPHFPLLAPAGTALQEGINSIRNLTCPEKRQTLWENVSYIKINLDMAFIGGFVFFFPSPRFGSSKILIL